MHLIVLLSISLFIVTFNRISVFDRLQFLEKKLHLKCLFLLPQNSSALPELKALVCGETFNQLQISQFYISSGLIHLFVVSGAHLIVLKKIADFFLTFFSRLLSEKIRKFVTLVILIVYSGMCEFNPPVIRALILILLNSELLFSKIFWPGHFKALFAGLIALLFNPMWLNSISLQLSWLIALGGLLNLYLLDHLHPLIKSFIQSVWIYPTLLFFQIPSPYFILTNLIFSQFLEFFFFPFAILVSIFQNLVIIFDPAVDFLKFILGKTELNLNPSALIVNPKLTLLNWILIFVLHFTLHIVWKVKKKSNEDI